MVPFDVALFKAPNFSVFDMSHDNKLNMGLGQVVPINWQILHPGERFTGEIGNLIRMQPLNGAILQHYDITLDTFFVPARLIFGKEKSETFFNLFEAGNNGFQHQGSIPQLSWQALYHLCKPGNLLDYLGYPTYKNLRSFVSSFINSSGWSIDSITDASEDAPTISGSGEPTNNLMSWPIFAPGEGDDVGKFVTYKYIDPSVFTQDSLVVYGAGVDIDYSGKTYPFVFNDNEVPDSFFIFLVKKCGIPLVADSTLGMLYVWDKAYTLDDLLLKLSISPEKAVEMYIDYVLDYLVSEQSPDEGDYNYVKSFYGQLVAAGKTKAPSILPIFAYWRIISDWFMNYNLSDMPSYELYDYLLSLALNPLEELYDDSKILAALRYGYSSTSADLWSDWGKNEDGLGYVGVPSGSLNDCFKRNWANDYFTSAFRSPQSGSAVPIPSSGNIPDLRKANVLQEIRERVIYAGRRYRDQVRAFFSVVPENSRLDVVEVLSREVQPLQISEVTQTNQGDLNKLLETPFGSFGGQSQTVGSHKICDYTADEHGVIMTLASIRPKAAYMQGVRRELMKTDVYDFLWPQLETIGEQEIYSAEIFADFDPDSTFDPDATFGYQRRYGEFMHHTSEVHGEMLNSLSYLHGARDFAHLPELNVNFGEIRPEDDDLNRVFVYSADERPFIVELYFDCKMIRPLSRYITYDL